MIDGTIRLTLGQGLKWVGLLS